MPDLKAGATAAAAILALLCLLPLPAPGQINEIEPNDPCGLAQAVGSLTSLPATIDGSLDTPPAIPDIDFYLVNAVPGTRLRAELFGEPSGQGTLADPLLGLFDADCNLLDFNDDFGSLESRLEFDVPAAGQFILAATSYPDGLFSGTGDWAGSYLLSLSAAQPPPLEITRVFPCTDLPPAGGTCSYAVRLRNTTDAPFNAQIWSTVAAIDFGSPLDFTQFQAGDAQIRRFIAGGARRLEFQFDLPQGLANRTLVCADLLVGRRARGYFGTVSFDPLFCLEKRASGYVPLSGVEAPAARALQNLRLERELLGRHGIVKSPKQ